MAVAVQSTNTPTTTTAGASFQVIFNKPTGLAVGDLMVAIPTARSGTNNAAWNTPSGWTSAGAAVVSASSNIVQQAFWKIADSTDAAASTFTFTFTTAPTNGSGTNIGGKIFRISGHDPTTPVVTRATGNAGTTSATVTGGVTPGVANCLLLAGVVAQSTTGYGSGTAVAVVNSNPTWTKTDAAGVLHGNYTDDFAYGLFTPATTTGDFTWAIGATSNNSASLMAIQPSGGVVAQNSNFLAFM